VVAAGCGGGGKHQEPAQVVRGTGYRFEAPAGWTVVRSGRQVQAAEGGKSLSLVAVSRFPLLRKAPLHLSRKALKELDRLARSLAAQQHGSLANLETTEVSGRDARRYDIDYEARGKKLVERIVFVLRGKTEYYLLCRFERAGDAQPCDDFLSSFRLT
jgi:hypothetical protein